MAINNLPNVRSIHLDSAAHAVATENSKRILLVGYTSNDTTSDTGTLSLPVGEVYTVSDWTTARRLTLNHDGTPSELTEALYEINAAVGEEVDLVIYRLGQTYSREGKFCNVEVSEDYTVLGFSSESGTQSDFNNATLLDAEDRYDDLVSAYDNLEDFEFDVLVPLEAYIDDSIESGSKDFGYLTALFCYKVSTDVMEVSAVLPVHTALEYAYKSDTTIDYRTGSPTLTQLTNWKKYLTLETGTNWGIGNFDPRSPGSLTSRFDEDTTTSSPSNHAYFLNVNETAVPTKYTDSTVDVDENGVPIDLGAYVMVVAGNTRFYNEAALYYSPTKGYYNKNPYVYIGALKAVATSTESLTHKTVNLVVQDTKTKLSLYDTLSGFGYTVVYSRNGTTRIGTAWTAAYHVSPYSKSDWCKEFTTRAATDILDTLRDVFDKYLGSRTNMTGMEEEATKWLAKYVEAGVINDFDLTFLTNTATSSMGVIYVKLTLTFSPEMNTVVLYTSLKRSVS